MNERIREARMYLGLSQAELADALNLSRNYISLVENGNRNISDRALKDFCNEFHINENWIRTGEGDMCVSLAREIIIAGISADLYEENEVTDLQLEILKLLPKLTFEQMNLLLSIAKELSKIKTKESKK